MRPRLLHLGYREAIVPGPSVLRGFNEAEAFTPRILSAALSIEGDAPRFNEAEAFTPRIPEGAGRGMSAGHSLQ